MSVEPAVTHPAAGGAEPSPAPSPSAFRSLESMWSSLSQQIKVAAAVLVIFFVVVAGVVVITVTRAVGARLFGGGSTLRSEVASVDTGPAAQMCNRKIADLNVTKDVDAGTVRVRFVLQGSPEGGPAASGRFLVRIFDANGQFLHAATSEMLVHMYGADPSSYWKDRDVDVQFSTNSLVLREAKMAEVGFVF